jgi:hypothetical protein
MIEFDQVAVDIEPCVFPCILYISVAKSGHTTLPIGRKK